MGVTSHTSTFFHYKILNSVHTMHVSSMAVGEKLITFLYGFDILFIMETERVYCAVRVVSLNII